MCANKRLSAEERKKEIMQSAAKVMSAKGFSHTTMEDVIAGTTMSKGGVYHYYKSTLEILRDLMVYGIAYRNQIIKEHMDEYQKGGEIEFLAKRLAEKVIDDNPYMPIYVQFLIEKKRKPELNDLFDELKAQTKKEMAEMMEDLPECFLNNATYDILTNFLNAMILAADVLDVRENLIANQSLLEKLFILVLQHGKE